MSINDENMPQALAAMMTKQEVDGAKLDRVCGDVEEIKQLLAPLKFSACTLLPWLRRNKYVALVVLSLITFWNSAVVWTVRAVQGHWPPGMGP